MEYRRLGKAGLQVSVLSFGSWVSFKGQMGVAEARSCMETAYDAGVNFFDNAESYAGGESERIMGAAIAEMGWPRHSYVISTKVFWGLHELAQHAEHAQPQVPDAGDRRLARTARSRLRRPAVLPPQRSAHADRGDGVGDVRHRRERQGALLGHVGVGRRRVPRRVGHRRPPSSAQAGDGAAAVPPHASAPGRAGVRAALRRLRARPHHVESRWRRASGRGSTSTASRKAAAARCRATNGSSSRSPTIARRARSARSKVSPTSSGAHSRNSRSRGARTTRTSRVSSPVRAAPRRSRRTSAPSTCSRSSTTA